MKEQTAIVFDSTLAIDQRVKLLMEYLKEQQKNIDQEPKKDQIEEEQQAE